MSRNIGDRFSGSWLYFVLFAGDFICVHEYCVYARRILDVWVSARDGKLAIYKLKQYYYIGKR